MIAAVALAVLLAGASPGGAPDARGDAASAGDGGVPDAGPALDPGDEDLVRHLDEVERRELLEELELFDGPGE